MLAWTALELLAGDGPGGRHLAAFQPWGALLAAILGAAVGEWIARFGGDG